MALPPKVNLGTAPNNGTGDVLRIAFDKLNVRDEYLEGLIESIKTTQVVSSLPSEPETQVLYVNVTDQSLQVWDGNDWIEIGSGEVTYQVVTDALGYIPEPELGNPVSDAMVLASDTDGTRYWVTQEADGGGVTQQYVDDADAATLASANSYTDTEVSGKEDVANKATDFTTENNTLYPSVQAVVNYINAQGFITDYDVTEADVLTALGYTPENVSNKAINFSTSNDTLYPTVKAVVDYLNAQGYITDYTVTEQDVISALGFNPANDSEVIKGIRDSEGNLIQPNAQREVTLPEIPANDFKTIGTLIELREYEGSTGEAVNVLGRGKKGDGLIAPFPFIWTDTPTKSDDDATCIHVGTGAWEVEIQGAVNLAWFGLSENSTAQSNSDVFAIAMDYLGQDEKMTANPGVYNINDIIINKSGFFNFSGVTFINNQEVEGAAITISENVTNIKLTGLALKYEGLFYVSNPNATEFGVLKNGITINGDNVIIEKSIISGFSNNGISGGSTSYSLFLNYCTCSNNGYAGALSSGKDFRITGGSYNENGGSNGLNGYGIVGNTSAEGKFIVTESRIERNWTRNIDSHNGEDIIISNNITEDAGMALPQWFNEISEGAYNIRLTQKITRAIVTGNVSKRATGAGIVFDSDSNPNHLLKDVLISNNFIDGGGSLGIYIRPFKTEKVIIDGNQIVNTDVSIHILPIGDVETFLNELSITSNQIGYFKLSYANNVPLNGSYINFNGNECSGGGLIELGSEESNVNINNNLFINRNVSFIGGGENSSILYASNTVDLKNSTDYNFSLKTDNGLSRQLIVSNIFKNSNHPSQLFDARENSVIKSNDFINCNNDAPGAIAIYAAYRENVVIVDNNINSPNNYTSLIRAGLINTNVTGNTGNANSALRLTYGTFDANFSKGVFDTVYRVFDLGLSSPPVLGEFVFQNGDKAINRGSSNSFDHWVYNNGEWLKRGFSENYLTTTPRLYTAQQGTSLTPSNPTDYVNKEYVDILTGAKPPVDETYADVSALLADQNNQGKDYFYEVTDASGLTAVSSGAAVLLYNASTPTGTESDYVIIWSEEDLDAITNITEIPNRSYNDLQDLPITAYGLESNTDANSSGLYIPNTNTSFPIPDYDWDLFRTQTFYAHGTSALSWDLGSEADFNSQVINIINKSTQTLTLTSVNTNNEIWEKGTESNSITIPAGESIQLANGQGNWCVRNRY